MMNYGTSYEMKICLIYELMKSISCDFSEKSALKERKNLALLLTKLVVNETNRQIKRIKKYPNEEKFYGTLPELREQLRSLKTLLKTIAAFNPGHQDGKYFRDTYPDGFYGMLKAFDIEEE